MFLVISIRRTPNLKNLEVHSLWVRRKKKPTFYSILLQELKYFFFKKKTSGFANTSLFTGDIDYVDMPVEGSYWILAITCMYPTLPPPP